jgi:hypothetical protein
MAAPRVKSVSRKRSLKSLASNTGESSEELLDPKRGYDRVRRRRAKSFRHLYRLLNNADSKVCYYCGKIANTLDHCPSLLLVDAVGVSYFEERAIPFVLIPACGNCNNDIGTAHLFRAGRVVQLDWKDFRKHVRANIASTHRDGC